MRKLLLFLLLASPLAAQNPTAVSGTITDPSGVAYYPATVTACLTPVTLDPIVNGQHVNQQIGRNYCAPLANTAPSGSFTLSLFPNSAITPGGTQWQFTVTALGSAPPAGKGSQTFQASITISGTTQDVGATLSAASVSLLNSGSSSATQAPIMGYYLSGDCLVANLGKCFYTPANTQQNNLCSYTSGLATVTCQTQTMRVSGSVTTNVVTYTYPVPTISNWAVGNSITVIGFSGGDAFFNITCTLTAVTTTSVSCALVHANGSSSGPNLGTIINTSAGPFVAADVGKRIFGYWTCMASVDISANANNGPMSTGTALTISAFVNSTQVTMSGNAASTVTIRTGFPQGGCVIWGTPDDAGAVAMDAAMGATTYCPKMHLAAANYMFTTPHFFTNPPACAALGVSSGANAGNIVYSSGFELEGRGSGTSVVYMTPGFPETGSCVNGFSKLGCWVIPVQGRWTNLQLTGGGNRIAYGIPTGTNLLEMDGPASLDNFVGTNMGGRSSNGVSTVWGTAAYLWSQLTQVNFSGWGTAALATPPSSSVTVIRGWFENIGDFAGIDVGGLVDYYTQQPLEFSKYHFICYDCTVDTESTVGSFSPSFVVNTGLRIKWYRGGMSTTLGRTANNLIGYLCNGAGCVFDAEDMFLDLATPNKGTGQVAIKCTAACTNYIKNSILTGTTGGFGYQDVAGSVFYDLGGNTIGNTSIVGSLVADGHSVKGACTGVGTAASTLGLYGTGPNVTLTTCTSAAIGSGIPVSGARTLQNLVVTATAAGTNASSGVVTVLKNGGATTITCTIGTGTACTDGTHQVAVVDGDLISIQFTTQAADTLAGVKAIVEWN